MKKGISIMAILVAITITVFIAGCSGSGNGTKVGFVNMNEVGLDEINQQVNEYGKKLAEEKGFSVLQEELKKIEEEARNTPEAVALKEKIKPLLEAWESMEKLKGGGNVEKIKAAETKFQKLMADSELMEAYSRFHNVVDSNERVIVKRKELAVINKDVMTDVNKKKAELVEGFYEKIKAVCLEVSQGKYSIVLGITEFSPDGKKFLKKIEILYCDKSMTEDLTEEMIRRMKFSQQKED